ncbi:MAG: peptidase [Halobacteriovoraceae bacterium]|nr:peptidase [Halobacteriovoraceae bacterium]|tara:strand:- start:5784 stop:6641 length:858 start_codon:yes stop_codon:yes gene_type:complete
MKLLFVFALVASLPLSASTKGVKVIYGEDNRVDVVDSTNAMYVELSKSTAGMVSKSDIVPEGNGMVKLRGGSLSSRGICSSERFATQPSVANCSGFLVGEDLLVTAGHCVRSASDCRRWKWVFDYKVESEDQTSVSVEESSVYGCKEVVNSVLSRSSQDDFALIKLDRKVTDRRILDYRRKGQISVGEKLVVIGHPSGLPTKIADGSTVRSLKTKYFQADLDTYGGNSGSAVFNAATGVVEGILVRGETDYVRDSRQGCMVSNVVSQNAGRGEDVTYITNIPELQ